MEVEEEAARLRTLFTGRDVDLVALLSSQLGTVKMYAQVLVGLCGLAVTVTGFSGANMIRAGSLSSGLMVCGIALVLMGLTLSLRTMMRLRWVTQELRDDLLETAIVVVRRRNHQQRAVAIAAAFVLGGLAAYLGSVVVAAFVSGNLR